MKAMILAAGAGTRVRPLTYMVPKPMIPLLGRPLMEFLVEHLRSHGVDQIVVNTRIGGSTVIAPDATIIGPAAIGAGSIIEAGAHVERSIVWEYIRVSGRATLRDSIVCGPYCVTSKGVTVSIDEATLRWVVDDARRTNPAQDVHGIADFVAQQL